jgi:RHS repeat-associated protein
MRSVTKILPAARVARFALGLSVASASFLVSGTSAGQGAPDISLSSMTQSGVYDSSSGENETGAAGGPAAATVDSSGMLSTSYPFALMKARGAAQPHLALTYSASIRRGLAGVGWTISVPTIERKNLSGGPRYKDLSQGASIQDADRFVYNGQPLVPICQVTERSCTAAPGETMPAFSNGWYYYRLANDSVFARFFYSKDNLTWIVQFKSGETFELGQSVSFNFLPPSIDFGDDSQKPFRWSLVAQHDAQMDPANPGTYPNHVLYVWTKFHTVGRADPGYLTDIYDTHSTGAGSGAKGPSYAPYAHHTRLVYEVPPPETAPGLDAPPIWRASPVLRLQRVDITSANFRGGGAREQVRRYHLGYTTNNARSYLTSVQLEGRCESPPHEDASYSLPSSTNCLALPATTFQYAWPFLSFAVHPIFGTIPDNAFIFDINGDGIPDFVGPSNDPSTPQQVALMGTGLAANALGVHGTMTVSSNPNGADTKVLSPLTGGVGSGILTAAGVTGLSFETSTSGLQIANFAPSMLSPTRWQWSLDSTAALGLTGAHVIMGSDNTCSPLTTPPCGCWPGNEGCVCTPCQVCLIANADTPSNCDIEVPVGWAVDNLFLGTTDYDGDSYPDAFTATPQGTFGSISGDDPPIAGDIIVLAHTTVRNPDGSLAVFGAYGSWQTLSNSVDGTVQHPRVKSRAAHGAAFQDMDGDGLPDWVSFKPNDARPLIFWRGLGDGRADFCGVSPPPPTSWILLPVGGCSEDEMMAHAVDVDVTGGPPNFQYLLDVTGDGRPDIVQHGGRNGSAGPLGITVYPNIDGRHFDTPLFIPASSIPGYIPGSSGLLFGDMDGSGNTDIVVVSGNQASYINLLAYEPAGALYQINNGLGGTTEIAYTSTAQLARCSRGSGECTDRDSGSFFDTAAWTTTSPQHFHVVTQVRTTNNLQGPNRVDHITDYAYRNPIWDGRELKFRGFQTVKARSRGPGLGLPSDPRDPATLTETTYLSGLCEIDYPGGSCPTYAVDRPFDVLGGQALDVETRDESGHVLSTVHNKYQVVKALDGMDGRSVRFTYPTQTRTFLYDTSGAAGSPRTTILDAIALPELNTTVQSNVRTWAASDLAPVSLLKTTGLDSFGNTSLTVDSGLPGVDPLIWSTTEWRLPLNDATGWLWRPHTTVLHGARPVPGAPADNDRTSTFEYDSAGNLKSATVNLLGTEKLDRRHAGGGHTADAPQAASSNGLIVVQQRDYDAYGNITRVRGPRDYHCDETIYDQHFSQLQVGRRLYVDPHCTGSAIASTYFPDRALEKPTLTFAPDLSMTTIQYDAFGRPTRITKPDPQTGAPSGNPTTVQYFDVAPIAGAVFPQRTKTTTSDGTKTSVTWAYSDGYGKGLFTIASADPAAGDPSDWIVSNGEQRSAKGAILAKHQPFFWKGDPTAYPIAGGFSSPATSGNYDAFGRLLDKRDEAGNLASRSVYHVLSVDLYDADTIAGGARAGMFATVVKDGHHRTTQTTKRMHSASGVDSVTTTTTFNSVGQPRVIERRHSADPNARVARIIGYDTFGRMVSNQEPNTSIGNTLVATDPSMWRYAYDDDGNLVGTSDARGCGMNITYDAAGRPLLEDYSPCLNSQDPHTDAQPNGDGSEVFYVYEGGQNPTGRLHEVFDRAARTAFTYDHRGRAVSVRRQLAKPGSPAEHLGDRYASHQFVADANYDELDRVVRQATGADVPELMGIVGKSEVSPVYSARGTVSSINSSYLPLLVSAAYDADGLPREQRLGDAAQTTKEYVYDAPLRRLKSTRIARTAPAFWSHATSTYPLPDPSEPTQQLDLERMAFDYDAVGNPKSAIDSSTAQWPAGNKLRSRVFAYDDLYRLTSVTYGTPDAFVSPFDWETRSNTGNPVPHVTATSRIGSQSFGFDWLGNLVKSQDEEGLFYDRSLGDVTYSPPRRWWFQTKAPNQISTAQLAGSLGGSLSVEHDEAGNMTALRVIRRGPCASDRGCNQRFTYDWDEVGQLARARRYDFVTVPETPTPSDPFYGTPPAAASADLRYAYDGGGTRVLKLATSTDGVQITTAEIFSTLRLERAPWKSGPSSEGDYVADKDTENIYLSAGGTTARLVYSPQALPTLGNEFALNAHLRVFFMLGDQLGSTSTVIDQETGEVVERIDYQAFGAPDADYRPARWEHFRENYRFSGKEDDIEVGLSYFGARYYAPALGQWISADPLTVHTLKGDPNPYAYVGGHATFDVDATGLTGQSYEEPFSTDPYENPTFYALQSYAMAIPPELLTPGAYADAMMSLDCNGALNCAGTAFDAFSTGVVNVPTDLLKAAATVSWVALKELGTAIDVATPSLTETLDALPNIAEPPKTGLLFYMAGSAAGGAALGDLAAGAGGLLRAGGASEAFAGAAGDSSAAARIGAMTDEGIAGGVGICFVGGTLVATPNGERPIETLRVGDRVRTSDDDGRGTTSIEPAAWRDVHVKMPNPDGSGDVLDIEILRPETWIAEVGAVAGGWISFGLPEMGLYGPAQVQTISATPPIQVGPGRVVRATVTHLNRQIHVLRFRETKEILQPTATHRLFSIDRHDWIATADLKVGEHLWAESGVVTIVSNVEKVGAERVFNIEVETEHSYLVGRAKILSHNTNPCAAPAAEGAGFAADAHPTFSPGPYAGASIPARSSAQVFTSGERTAINEIMADTGCHTCGTKNPGTVTGNAILDHQPVSALNFNNVPQLLFPQCLQCSSDQGIAVARALAALKRSQ